MSMIDDFRNESEENALAMEIEALRLAVSECLVEHGGEPGKCDVETFAEAATIAFGLGWRLEVVAQRIFWRPKIADAEGKQ